VTSSTERKVAQQGFVVKVGVLPYRFFNQDATDSLAALAQGRPGGKCSYCTLL
jgi:hypothetical protein